jgi:hypothetical protein
MATILLEGPRAFTYTSETQDLKAVIGKIIKKLEELFHDGIEAPSISVG